MKHQYLLSTLIQHPIRIAPLLLSVALLSGCATTESRTAADAASAGLAPDSSFDRNSASPETAETSSSSAGETERGSYPKIRMDADENGTQKVTAKFEFEGQQVSFTLRVSEALLQGARNAYKFAVAKAGEGDADWRERYNMAFITDPAQESFLNELHGTLVDIAKKQKLDDDRTVELFISFVQYIKYDEQDDAEARFPVETFADQEGDCDDKSRLLVSLLSRSGYGTATLNFNDENHMAVGIKADAMEYRGTGYAYVETTSPSMVGFPFSDRANVQLHTTPVVQKIGKGKKKYKAAKTILFLVDTKKKLETEIEKAQKEIDKIAAQAQSAEAVVKKRESELNRAQSGAAQQRAVDKYNKAVDDYNALIERQKKAARAVNQKIEVRNYIATHANDRYNTYTWVKKQLRQQ
ncbi:MAG: hypothetical protein JXX29_23970 [Deltaproteobacteria bacterium]|nr:hypothetical protein [Deltaproteobacteria bacterium]MBN2674760.1 hypothetical protein [Deltaproteobacteria bacterium]